MLDPTDTLAVLADSLSNENRVPTVEDGALATRIARDTFYLARTLAMALYEIDTRHKKDAHPPCDRCRALAEIVKSVEIELLAHMQNRDTGR